MSTQALIIAYEWEGMDFTPKFTDVETGEVTWGTKHYRIFIWGHDQYNDPVCWIVEDYKPYCYVRIEEDLENEDEVAPHILDCLHQNIKAYIKEKSNEPNKAYLKGLVRCNNIIQGYEPLDKRPFFYWNKEKHRIYKLYFHLQSTMELCYEYLSHRKIHLPNGTKIAAKAYNNGVSDRIPTEEKMMVDQKLQRCFWMYGQAQLVKHDGITTLEKEYIVSWRAIQMLPREYAGKLGFPKPCTISFDSETWSEVFTRFPKPTRLRDMMYATGFRYRKYASLADKNPTIINYIFAVWDHKQLGEFKDYSKKYGQTVYIYCKTEKDLYLEMFAKIIELDPSWIITYNGLGYDWDYLEQRCSILDIKIPNLSRIRGWYKSQFTRKTWKRFSSAWPQYPGRIDVDMLYIIRLTMKFNSYKLKHVARALLPATEQKVELSYKEQFRIYGAKEWKGMNKIVNYLLGDIFVPEKLFDKLSMPIYLHTNASVMHCNPMSLYTDGQSIRCVNQLHEETQENGMYINSREIPKSGKYIGGLVFDPDPGIYENVLTFDWNSLYPSKMNVDNICFTTLINEKEEALKAEAERVKDEECHVVEGDVPIVDKKTKEVISVERHRFRYIKNSTFKGLLPRIVTKLNALRNEYKAEMAAAGKKADAFKAQKEALDKQIQQFQQEHATEENIGPGDLAVLEDLQKQRAEAAAQEELWLTEKEIWNVKQMAVKVSANSMYGFMGMKTGKFSFIEGGMSTTIGGRDALRETLRIVIEDFGAKLVYGDSVTGATPLLLRNLLTGSIFLRTIEDLYATSNIDEKLIGVDGKEYRTVDQNNALEVWTELGWSKIQNVMRHQTAKGIFAVTTRSGYVEVTEDHSLLSSDGKEVTPKELKVGDTLMTSYPPENRNHFYNGVRFTPEIYPTQLEAAKRYRTLHAMGGLVAIRKVPEGFEISDGLEQPRGSNEIVSIELLNQDKGETYVYDLTTENHHFQAGIGDIIVHNTDSVMVQFPESYINRGNYKTKTIEIAKYISSKFPEGMNIAPENFFLQFLVASKKRYGGIKVNPKNPMVDPTEKELLDPKLALFYVKGFISVRGNSCGIVYENFNPFLIKLMLRQPVDKIFQSIHEMVTRVMRREYPLDDYIFRQKLGNDYKSASNEMAVFTDRLKQAGRNHKPGEELEYVIVKTFDDCLKGHKMQAPDLFEENNCVLDTLHYVTHNLAKPIEQLLCCVYDDQVLKPHEKKFIRPKKPTKAQKVTPVWHLELYIERYVAGIHERWMQVVNHVKCIAFVAEQRGIINYVNDGAHIPRRMKELYGVEWTPKQNVPLSYEVLKKNPIHRHSIWLTGVSSQEVAQPPSVNNTQP